MWKHRQLKWIAFFLCFFMVSGAWAKPHWVQADAPESYTVRKGDTLWDIAGRFLHEPWRWPQIWSNNPEIKNPDLIYPGDIIYLRYDAHGNPRLHVERGKKAYWEKGQKVIKLSPKIRKEPAEGAIPIVPMSVIAPFFNRSQVITEEGVKKAPKIVALDEDHLLVGAGDRIYAAGLLMPPDLSLYTVFRVDKTYQDPKTKKILGVEALNLGKAQLEQPGNPALLILRQSNYEIRIGDKLMPPMAEEVDAYFTPKYPFGNPSGQIISVFGGLSQIGQYEVVVITGGADQQRASGDVLGVYQNQKDLPSRLKGEHQKYDFPALKVARMLVFRVFDEVSYALVMSATRPIYLYDNVGEP